MINLKEVYESFISNKYPKDVFCKGSVKIGTGCLSCIKCQKEVKEYMNRYIYYWDIMNCYGQYESCRSCNICKNINPILFNNCKDDSVIWSKLWNKVITKPCNV